MRLNNKDIKQSANSRLVHMMISISPKYSVCIQRARYIIRIIVPAIWSVGTGETIKLTGRAEYFGRSNISCRLVERGERTKYQSQYPAS